MRIVSWNVNGLRAIYKKGNWNWIVDENPDIFCLQEIKSEDHQLPEEVRNPAGYFSYFNSSQGRKGYSGVAIYSKVEPHKVEYGMNAPEYDTEGRLIVAYYDNFVLLNCYFPNGGGGPVRLQYKMDFYAHFLKFVNELRGQGFDVIICGDVNTAHTATDLARPKENEKNTGFLPMERKWIDTLLESGFLDIWRDMHVEVKDEYTYWDMKTFSRERNVGWRIDYFFVNQELKPCIKKTLIHKNVLGSDHCPIEIVVEIK